MKYLKEVSFLLGFYFMFNFMNQFTDKLPRIPPRPRPFMRTISCSFCGSLTLALFSGLFLLALFLILNNFQLRYWTANPLPPPATDLHLSTESVLSTRERNGSCTTCSIPYLRGDSVCGRRVIRGEIVHIFPPTSILQINIYKRNSKSRKTIVEV